MNAQLSTQTLTTAPPTRKRSGVRRSLLRIGGALLVVLFGLVAYFVWRMSYVPADLDTATTRLSEQGLYRGSYVARLDPLVINQMHTWTFHLENADGQPLTGAQITVDGGMPQHGHGLPTSPQVTKELGAGDYQVEGMKFNMPGWWVVNFHITANGQRDTLTFNLILE